MNEWDEQEKRAREKEQMEASLYRSRSRLHGTGLTEDQQEEREFRRSFPSYHKVNIYQMSFFLLRRPNNMIHDIFI